MKPEPLHDDRPRAIQRRARGGILWVGLSTWLLGPSCASRLPSRADFVRASEVTDRTMGLSALIDQLYVAFSFDASGEADWEALRGHFARGATFVSPVPPGGTPEGVDAETFLADFQRFIRTSPLGATGYHERVVHARIEQLGAIAHAWVTFEAFVPGQPADRRGVDSLQFVRDVDAWKLISFTTQYESGDVELPARFLPQ